MKNKSTSKEKKYPREKNAFYGCFSIADFSEFRPQSSDSYGEALKRWDVMNNVSNFFVLLNNFTLKTFKLKKIIINNKSESKQNFNVSDFTSSALA